MKVTIDLEELATETILVPIRGTRPLIVNRFIPDLVMGPLTGVPCHLRPPTKERDPQTQYEEAFYRLPDGGYGFPVKGFMSGIAEAAQRMSQGKARRYIALHGEVGTDGFELVRIDGAPRMREDVVRQQRRKFPRYRPEFPSWKTQLNVTYASPFPITRKLLLGLIQSAGFSIGVGDWRFEMNGNFGGFEIDPDRETVVVP